MRPSLPPKRMVKLESSSLTKATLKDMSIKRVLRITTSRDVSIKRVIRIDNSPKRKETVRSTQRDLRACSNKITKRRTTASSMLRKRRSAVVRAVEEVAVPEVVVVASTEEKVMSITSAEAVHAERVMRNLNLKVVSLVRIQ